MEVLQGREIGEERKAERVKRARFIVPLIFCVEWGFIFVSECAAPTALGFLVWVTQPLRAGLTCVAPLALKRAA